MKTTTDRWAEAVAAFHSGDFDEAETAARDVVVAQSGHADALHLVAALEHRKGQHEQARQFVEQAIQIDPKNHEYYNTNGAIRLAMNDYWGAKVSFQASISQQTDYAEAHHNLGICQEKLEELDEAEQSFRRAISLNPNYASAHYSLARLLERLGRLEEAIESVEAALQLQPRFAQGYYLAGKLLQRAGEPAHAEQRLRQCLSLTPRSVDALNALGVVCASRGETQQALDCFRQALQINPEVSQTHANLGTALMELEEFEEARSHLEQACQRQPNVLHYQINFIRCLQGLQEDQRVIEACRRLIAGGDASGPVYRYLGLSLERTEELEEAESAYRSAVERDPADSDALFALARLAGRNDRHSEAIELCRKTLLTQPEYPGAHLFLGQLLLQDAGSDPSRVPLPQARSVREEAVLLLKRAVDLNPAVETHMALGQAYHETREHARALECFTEAHRLAPDNLNALNSLGNVLTELGRMQEAVEYLERAIEIAPNSARAHFYLTKSRKSENPDADIAHLRRVLEQDNLTDPQRIQLHFSIARISDDHKRYDEAFRAYQAGNELKPLPDFVQEHGRARQDEEFVDKMIETFTEDFFAERSNWGDPTTRPIFVVGVPRSGTTLTEQILSSHSQVYGAGELGDIGYYSARVSQAAAGNAGYPLAAAHVARESILEFAQTHDRYLKKVSRNAGFVVDKMPGNFFHLGLIALMFPNAKIVHCSRNPLDTCVSCFRNNLDWPFCDLTEMGHYCLRYRKIMDHWRKVLPVPIYEQNYEDFVENFDDRVRSLVAHCGLDWEDQILEYYKEERPVGTPSRWQVRQPIYGSSVGVWKRYEPHLKHLREILGL